MEVQPIGYHILNPEYFYLDLNMIEAEMTYYLNKSLSVLTWSVTFYAELNYLLRKRCTLTSESNF